MILVIDALRGPTIQDQKLARYIVDHGKGLILAINKWDLIADKTAQTMKIVTRHLRDLLPGLDWVPIIFISAYTGRNVKNILEQVLAVHQEQNKRLDQKDLNEFLKEITGKHKPVPAKGLGRPKIYSLVQTRIKPPEFIASIHHEYTLHFSYLRFLENQLRKHFGFIGTPIRIRVKKQANR